jgi:hypothetical protein
MPKILGEMRTLFTPLLITEPNGSHCCTCAACTPDRRARMLGAWSDMCCGTPELQAFRRCPSGGRGHLAATA